MLTEKAAATLAVLFFGAPAPLFDNGLSLLTYAMDDDLQDWETYAKTRVPATYSDFIELAQQLMGTHKRKNYVGSSILNLRDIRDIIGRMRG